MEPEIAFNTGYLMGYLMKKGVEAFPVFDDEGNYRPFIDISVPTHSDDPLVSGVKVIRVKVIREELVP